MDDITVCCSFDLAMLGLGVGGVHRPCHFDQSSCSSAGWIKTLSGTDLVFVVIVSKEIPTTKRMTLPTRRPMKKVLLELRDAALVS